MSQCRTQHAAELWLGHSRRHPARASSYGSNPPCTQRTSPLVCEQSWACSQPPAHLGCSLLLPLVTALCGPPSKADLVVLGAATPCPGWDTALPATTATSNTPEGAGTITAGLITPAKPPSSPKDRSHQPLSYPQHLQVYNSPTLSMKTRQKAAALLVLIVLTGLTWGPQLPKSSSSSLLTFLSLSWLLGAGGAGLPHRGGSAQESSQ